MSDQPSNATSPATPGALSPATPRRPWPAALAIVDEDGAARDSDAVLDPGPDDLGVDPSFQIATPGEDAGRRPRRGRWPRSFSGVSIRSARSAHQSGPLTPTTPVLATPGGTSLSSAVAGALADAARKASLETAAEPALVAAAARGQDVVTVHDYGGPDMAPATGTFVAGVDVPRQTIKRRTDASLDAAEVLIGTPIREDHVNYMLMYDMLTGIRISVSRCNAKPDRQLTPGDFAAAHKLAFDISGNELTPSSKYDFKFKDYAPYVFRKLRRLFKVEAGEYLLSLTSKYVLSELGSPGKSGSFFYYSQDYRFIIKTIHHSEHETLLRVLQPYYEHVRDNPHTLLCRIFGVHRVKLPGGRKIHFVVMGNILPPNKDIHEVFDLKGSTVGRFTPEDRAPTSRRAVLKDLNWVRRGMQLELAPPKARLLIRQLERDVAFLQAMRIMDYSLLVGWHNLQLGNTQNLRDQTLAVFEPQAAAAAVAAAAVETAAAVAAAAAVEAHAAPAGTPRAPSAKRASRLSAVRRLLAEAEAASAHVLAGARLPDDAPDDRKYCIFYQDEGGFYSSRPDAPAAPTGIYYLGIIDIFTGYSLKKRTEHFLRSFISDSRKISAVNAVWYGDRFLEFMRAAVSHATQSLPRAGLRSVISAALDAVVPEALSPEAVSPEAVSPETAKTEAPDDPAVSSEPLADVKRAVKADAEALSAAAAPAAS